MFKILYILFVFLEIAFGYKYNLEITQPATLINIVIFLEYELSLHIITHFLLLYFTFFLLLCLVY